MYLVGGETDDLIQEGMLGLFKALRDLIPPGKSLSHPLPGLCIERQLYNAIQSSNRQKHQPLNTYISLSDEEFASELRQISVQNPEAIIIDQENAAGIEEKIHRTLSKFENQVLKMYLEGADISRLRRVWTGRPSPLTMLLQRIRQKVKACITKSLKNNIFSA